MKTIDALGLACPHPVILTKKVIREGGKENILVLVDNEIATQNLSKMAKQLGLDSKVVKKTEKLYEVTVIRGNSEIEIDGEQICDPMNFTGEYSVIVNSDMMGIGDRELGEKLIGSFIYALTEQDVLPVRVVFYNGGVKLTTEGSKVIEDLRKLQEAGVEVLSCGLCLDYYGLKEKLKVGEVTNMYRIVEIMRTGFCVRP